ncbi:hypothetical protein QYM36_009599, partial [Artemia franciscana]
MALNVVRRCVERDEAGEGADCGRPRDQELVADMAERSSVHGILTADRAEKSSVPEELAADMAERSSVHGILTADRAEKSSLPEELAADMAERSSVHGILTADRAEKSSVPEELVADMAERSSVHGILTADRAEKNSQVFAEEVEPTGLVPIEVSLERYRFAALPTKFRENPVESRLKPRTSTRFFPGSTILSQNKTTLQKTLNAWYGSPNQQWRMVYKAGVHGFSSEAFHKQCDGVSPTYVIVQIEIESALVELKDESNGIGGLFQEIRYIHCYPTFCHYHQWAKKTHITFIWSSCNNPKMKIIAPFTGTAVNLLGGSGHICGGFSDIPWVKSGPKGRYGSSEKAFIFTLVNNENVPPTKFPVTKKMYAVCFHH